MELNKRFRALLCLFFGVMVFAAGRVSGQEVKIGDKVPDVWVRSVSGLRLNGRLVGGGAVKLSAFSGKLLILDFWATWCAPCRAMVPVMDSLQRVFGDKMVFLPVAYESAEVVAPVIAAMQKVRPFDLPEVTSDVVLGRLFPHRSLPHYVWIGGDGVVLAITEDKEVTGDNIRKLLLPGGGGGLKSSGSGVSRGVSSGAVGLPVLALKKDSVSAYDGSRPLFFDGNGGDASGMVYHSLLTGFKPGLVAGMTVTKFDEQAGQCFTARNVPFVWLCRLAFGEGGKVFMRSRTVLETRDSLRLYTALTGQAYDAWLASGNGFCYELSLPPWLATSAIPLLQGDLARLFPAYRVYLQERVLPCLAMVRTGPEDKLKSAGGELSVSVTPYRAELRNAHLSQLMMRLERQYLQNSKLPVVDATGYSGRVDLSLDARLYDVAELNCALAPYGLALRVQTQKVEVMVIADNDSFKPKL